MRIGRTIAIALAVLGAIAIYLADAEFNQLRGTWAWGYREFRYLAIAVAAFLLLSLLEWVAARLRTLLKS